MRQQRIMLSPSSAMMAIMAAAAVSLDGYQDRIDVSRRDEPKPPPPPKPVAMREPPEPTAADLERIQRAEMKRRRKAQRLTRTEQPS